MGGLVQADVADALQQGEVDDACRVLLVVHHQFAELVVLLAGEVESSVVATDKVDHLS